MYKKIKASLLGYFLYRQENKLILNFNLGKQNMIQVLVHSEVFQILVCVIWNYYIVEKMRMKSLASVAVL